MDIVNGKKLSEIISKDVESVGISTQGNLYFKYYQIEEPFFVYDNLSNKISETKAIDLSNRLLKEFLGNKDVLNFLVSKLPPKKK